VIFHRKRHPFSGFTLPSDLIFTIFPLIWLNKFEPFTERSFKSVRSRSWMVAFAGIESDDEGNTKELNQIKEIARTFGFLI
jgi:hypothetical protein